MMKEYTYSVARVRAREASLLTRLDIDQLLTADSYESALRTVRDRGYRAQDSADAEEIASAARQDMWDFLAELADVAVLRVLRLPIDYHNVKASVKSVFSRTDGSDLLLSGGTVDPERIYDCVKRREYNDLDPRIAEVCEEALSLLLRTQDGQVCDMYIDNAMLAAIEETASRTGDAFIQRYADLLADTANLKTAFRCARTERNFSFIENAIYDGGTLNASSLIPAAASGLEALCGYIASTSYGGAADAMRAGASALEKWCGDEIMRFMDEARLESFTAAPIIAYYYAKTTEINAVRLILLGKRSQLSDSLIRERVPRTYV